MAAAILLGVLIGVALGALGGGGSILAVPVLVYVAGQDPKAATATSLVAVIAAAAVGTINHARAGNIRWKPALAFIVTAVPGSWLGSQINDQINGDVLLLGFAVLVLVAAWRMLTACPSCTRSGEEAAIAADELVHAADAVAAGAPPGAGFTTDLEDVAALPQWARPRLDAAPSAGEGGGPTATIPEPGGAHGRPGATLLMATKVLGAGLTVGFLTGLFGVGGGFVIVPALTLALALSMPEAIGTSLVIIVGNGLIALWFRGTGSVDWDVALPFTIAMLIGSLIGSAVGSKLPAQKSLRAFAVLLVAVAIGTGIAAGWALAT